MTKTAKYAGTRLVDLSSGRAVRVSVVVTPRGARQIKVAEKDGSAVKWDKKNPYAARVMLYEDIIEGLLR